MDMCVRRWDARGAVPEARSLEASQPAAESSADASLPTVLGKLVTDATEALDYDHEVARALLRQVTALLQSWAEWRGPTVRAPAQAALAPWQAKRIASHIDDNLDRRLPLGELARVAGLSNSYFSRAFKGAFEQTPHAFIIGRRVERAQQEMLEGREPLSQIALSCGFADQAHLARIFRRETGLAPSEWRRANRPAAGLARGEPERPSPRW